VSLDHKATDIVPIMGVKFLDVLVDLPFQGKTAAIQGAAGLKVDLPLDGAVRSHRKGRPDPLDILSVQVGGGAHDLPALGSDHEDFPVIGKIPDVPKGKVLGGTVQP